MRRVYLFGNGMLLMAVAMTMMTACGKTEKADREESAAADVTTTEVTPKDDVATDSLETVEDTATVAVQQETEGQGTEIDQMAASWKALPLAVYPAAEKVNIQDFARAFCRQYSKYRPNGIILNYLDDPKKFNQEAEMCYVTSDVPNGFLRLAMANQYDKFTEMCYWKRPGGHSLIGTYMRHETEGDFSESAFMFYDYDPATKKMTPDMEVFGIVEKAVQEGDFDDFILRLPQKGKDIELSMYKDNGDGGCEPTEWMLKWTGNSFKLVKKQAQHPAPVPSL